MKYTSIFVIVLSSLLFAQFLMVSAEEVKVDSRFDPGSASLAKTWHNLKGKFPHEKIPSDSETIKHPDDWAMDYGVGLVKIVGLGFAIAILSILVGVVYGIFKLIRMCCCSKKDDSDYEDEDEDKYTYSQKWGPALGYFICFVFLLTGMIFGLVNNPRFSDGVTDMGNSVVSVGNDAIGLADGLINSVDGIVQLIPQTIRTIQDQFAGVPALSADVEVLSVDINATSIQISNITAQMQAINLRNASGSIAGIKSELDSINNSSGQIISSMTTLTDQISGNLLSTYNNTLSSLNEKTADIDETVAELKATSDDIKEQAKDLVDKVTDGVEDVKGYDKSRGTAVMVLFVLVIIVSFVIILGFLLRQKFIFNTISAIFFVFLFLLWLSGSIHFLLGMVLYDACPVIDVTVKGLLPQDSQGAEVLEGCLYEHRSVLDSLNITAYNLTDVFSFKDEFSDFASFSKDYNFSSIDDYFSRIENLYSYNLTEVADNLTVQAFGWNETIVYVALDNLNIAAEPDYPYTLQNYTEAEPNDFTNPKRAYVQGNKTVLNETVYFNRSIYEEVATAKNQLYAVQADIDVLVVDMSSLQSRFGDVKSSVNQLETTNISNSIAALDYLQANITGFFELGNCSFLGETYAEITVSLCETMQPSIDLLTVAQFLAGLALIPMVVLAEILSFRIPKASSINPLNFGDSGDYDDEEKGTKMKNIAMSTEKPLDSSSKRHSNGPGISATISAEPPATSSANSSPDFSGRRRTVAEHFNAHPPQIKE
jgi:gas vesicle protein/Na+-transporting methylmalonyl-CoA/oxaloacetate decarboxylase gamma subunit